MLTRVQKTLQLGASLKRFRLSLGGATSKSPSSLALLGQRRFRWSHYGFGRGSCRRSSGWIRRGPDAVLCQQGQMLRFVRVDVAFKFLRACLCAHPIVKHRVIGTQSPTFFQICLCLACIRPCVHQVAIINNAIGKLPPLRMQARFIRRFSKRTLLERLIQLLDRRNTRCASFVLRRCWRNLWGGTFLQFG